MPMNLKDEIVAGESYSLEFKRVPNERIFDNRVEITSPGGLPRGQTADRALAGYSKIRNDVLAKVLNYMRYIEEWGSGLRRVNRVLAEYGIRPVAIDEAAFATQMNVYRITAPGHEGNEGNEGNREGNEGNRADNHADNADDREDNHKPNEPNRAPNGTNGGTNGTNSGTNGTNQIVECLRETPSISLDELAKRIGVSRRTVVRMVDRLKKEGRIRRKGGTRGVWEVL